MMRMGLMDDLIPALLIALMLFIIIGAVITAALDDRPLRCRHSIEREVRITVISPDGLSYDTKGTQPGCDWYEVRS